MLLESIFRLLQHYNLLVPLYPRLRGLPLSMYVPTGSDLLDGSVNTRTGARLMTTIIFKNITRVKYCTNALQTLYLLIPLLIHQG